MKNTAKCYQYYRNGLFLLMMSGCERMQEISFLASNNSLVSENTWHQTIHQGYENVSKMFYRNCRYEQMAISICCQMSASLLHSKWR